MNAYKKILAFVGIALVASLLLGQTQPGPVGGQRLLITEISELGNTRVSSPGTQPVEMRETTFSILVAWDPQRVKLLDSEWTRFLRRSKVVNFEEYRVEDALWALTSSLSLRLQALTPGDWPKKSPVHTASGPAPDLPPLPPGWKVMRIEGTIAQKLRPDLWPENEVPLEKAAFVTRHKLSEHLLSGLHGWLNQMDYLPESKETTKAARNAMKAALRQLDSARANADKEVPQIDQDIRALGLDAFGKRSRAEVISAQIQDLRDKGAARVNKDPIVTQLGKVLELRVQARNHVTSTVRAADESAQMVREAELKVIEAQVQLAQRKEAVLAGTSGELLARLGNEQVMIMIDLSEIQAKTRYLEFRRSELLMAVTAAQEKFEQAELQSDLALPWRVIKEKWAW